MIIKILIAYRFRVRVRRLSESLLYHDYANIFSKSKADALALHRPCDLQINLEKGASPPVGAVYSLSQSELSALHEFLDEHQ